MHKTIDWLVHARTASKQRFAGGKPTPYLFDVRNIASALGMRLLSLGLEALYRLSVAEMAKSSAVCNGLLMYGKDTPSRRSYFLASAASIEAKGECICFA